MTRTAWTATQLVGTDPLPEVQSAIPNPADKLIWKQKQTIHTECNGAQQHLRFYSQLSATTYKVCKVLPEKKKGITVLQANRRCWELP